MNPGHMYVPVYGPNTRRPPSQTLTASGRMSSRVALESTRSCASFTTSCIVGNDRHQVDRVLACPLRCIKGEILCLTCSSIAKLIHCRECMKPIKACLSSQNTGVLDKLQIFAFYLCTWKKSGPTVCNAKKKKPA